MYISAFNKIKKNSTLLMGAVRKEQLGEIKLKYIGSVVGSYVAVPNSY
jgi:hypothetical protein